VDLEWLKVHARDNPDARLSDRVDDWEKVSGERVAVSTMSLAMRAIGWSFKKNSSRLRA
jgi:hypothetical protein